LMAPYLLWVTVAALLNRSVMYRNPQASGAA
jgi:tryptophan-rich sensory protein